MSPARLTAAIIGSVWKYALAGASLRMVFNISSVLLPVAIGMFVDTVIAPAAEGAAAGQIARPLAASLAALLGLYVMIHIGYRFGGRLGWYGVQRAQHELSQHVLARIVDERGMGGAVHPPGRLLSLATADTRRSCQSVYIAVYPPGELIGLLVAAGVLFWVNPVLGVGVIIALPLVLGLMHVVARPLMRRSEHEQSGLADAAASAADLVAGYRVISGLHAQQTAAHRYRDVSRKSLRATIAARAALAAFNGASTAIGLLFAAVVVIGAALLAFTGEISVGQLVAVSGIALTLIGPLDALIGTLGAMWAMSQASAERVLRLLSAPANPASLGAHGSEIAAGDTQGTSTLAGTETPALAFDRVGFAEDIVVDDTIGSGEFVVLDLPQRARSQLSELLALKTVPASGQVLYAGRALNEYRPSAVRSRLLVLPHVPGLFRGTVLDNVRAGSDDDVGLADAETALGVAALKSGELPEGYDTEVGDGAWQLSGGQRQRIALARAVAADPEILVLHDPTSSLDALTEHQVASSLSAHRAGRMTLVLTASPAFHAVADRVIRIGRKVRRDA